MMTRIRPLLPALLALLCAGALHAQPTQQSIRGRVVDRETGEPIASAALRVVEASGDASVTGQTDFAGRFSIRLPIPGTWVVTAERIGFSVFTSGPVAVAAGAEVEVEVRMHAVALALDSLAVQVRQTPRFRDPRAASFWDRAERRRGVYLTPDQIAARSRMGTTDLLRGLEGIFLEGDPTRGTQLFLGVSALRRCSPTLYIDGRRRRLAQDERLDDYVERAKLWAIEVYARPADAPSELPPDDNYACGVVAIWTRNA